jgi:cytidine deaminase
MELIAAATVARQQAYVPYSGFAVGAAVRADDGRIFTGCNIENASYGLTCCAERVAVFHAVAAGVRQLVDVAVIADTDGPCMPCGACRQVLSEFGPHMQVHLTSLQGHLLQLTMPELLPGAFAAADMVRTGTEA